MAKKHTEIDPAALQQVNPEINNLLRQVEMLKSLSEARPSETNNRKALSYINAICTNMATIVYHVNGADLSDHKPFHKAFIGVMKRCGNSEGAVIKAVQHNAVLDGIFDMDELMKFVLVAAPPKDVEAEDE